MNVEGLHFKVTKKAVLSLVVVSLFVGVYFASGSLFAGSLLEFGLFAITGAVSTIAIGFVFVIFYGAPVYTCYLVYPWLPLSGVFIASAIPGAAWVYLATPPLDATVFVMVGPATALLLHLMMKRELNAEPGEAT